MEAIEEFDQQGELQDELAEGKSGETGELGKGEASGTASLIMEQWLLQIEGNPAHLLRNQFIQEERRTMQQRGGPLREPRPW